MITHITGRAGVTLGSALLIACSVGCMVSPTDWTHLSSYTSPIRPAGFMDTPSTLVTIEAYNFYARRWESVGTARSSRSAYYWDGRNWYYWQTPQIKLTKEDYWSCTGTYGAVAKIRATSRDVNLYTFSDYDWTPDKNLGNVGTYNGFEVELVTTNPPYKCWD